MLAIGGTMVPPPPAVSLGALVAFFLYLNRFFQPIQLLVQQYNTYQQGQASVVKLRDLCDTEPEVRRGARRRRAAAHRGRHRASTTSPSATYPAGPVLEDVDLTIAPGRDGGLRRAHRRRQVDHGQAGHPLLRPDRGPGAPSTATTSATSPCDSLRSQLGVVPQEPFLFAGTIGDNIAFARPDATDDEIREAVRAGRARPTSIDRMPHGPRHRRPRAGPDALLGRAPAHRPGPRLPGPPPGAGARRGHLQPRPPVRDQDRGGARRPAREPHGHPHRPPAVDGHAGRPHRRGRRGPDHRGRHATTSWWPGAAATPRCTRPGSASPTPHDRTTGWPLTANRWRRPGPRGGRVPRMSHGRCVCAEVTADCSAGVAQLPPTCARETCGRLPVNWATPLPTTPVVT